MLAQGATGREISVQAATFEGYARTMSAANSAIVIEPYGVEGQRYQFVSVNVRLRDLRQ